MTEKGSQALEPLVRVQEPQWLKGKLPELLVAVPKFLASLGQVGRFLLYLGEITKVLKSLEYLVK